MMKKMLLFVWLALAIIGALAIVAYMCITAAWVLLPFALSTVSMSVPTALDIYREITSE